MAASTIRIDTDAPRDITGLAGGADGRIAILTNVGADPAVFTDEDGSSTAGNRFDLGYDLTLPAQGGAILRYDDTLSRWYCIGAWLGSSSGGITQLTGDVTAGPGSGSQAATIANSAVTLAKIANIADQTILGNDTGGAAAPVALTASQVRTLLSLVVGTNVQEYDAELTQIAGLADPNADRILFWDAAASSYAFLAPGTGVEISGTTLRIADADYNDIVVSLSGTTWTIDNLAVTTAKINGNAVTFAKLQTLNNKVLIGNDGSGTTAEEITLDSSLDMTSTVLGVVAASDTVAGKIEVAVQSEQETATSTTLAVTPGRQQYHPSAAKAWINFNGTGAIATRVSYNVTGINDLGTGHYSIDWNTDFSSGNYACGAMGGTDASTYATYVVVDGATAPTAGTLTIYTFTTAITVIDSNYVEVAAFGDQ